MVAKEIATTQTKFPKIAPQLSCIVAKYDNNAKKSSPFQRTRRPASDGVEVTSQTYQVVVVAVIGELVVVVAAAAAWRSR